MKKIVFLIDNLKGGGAEKAIKIISEGLFEKNYRPILVLLENKLDYSIDENLQIISLTKNLTKFNFVFLLPKLIKVLKIVKPDIVYATNTKSQILCLLARYFLKSQIIINMQVDLTKQYEKRCCIFSIYSKLLRYSDLYSFVSYGIYENVKNKIPNKKDIFIPNPIDFGEIDTLKLEKIEEQYKHIFEKKVFITIGRLSEQKGQLDLIKAFNLSNIDANLVILGEGEKEQELKNLVKKYGMDDRVFFLGFQKNPFKYLYNANIFVLSSLWEGFGNVIVEAMRCELPIISTDCPSGPREILSYRVDYFLKDEIELVEYGILVPVGDFKQLSVAMQKIFNDKNLLIKYKEKSIQRAKIYSKEIVVNEFITKVLRD